MHPISNEILKAVLRKNNIPENSYSIGVPSEQRVCIEKSGDEYCVYVMERGIKFDVSNHNTIESAHSEFLHQLSSSHQQYLQMLKDYKQLSNKLTKTKTAIVSPMESIKPTNTLVIKRVVFASSKAKKYAKKRTKKLSKNT